MPKHTKESATMPIDTKRVNAAVKIAMAINRHQLLAKTLGYDLGRLKAGMSTEEYNQYIERTS